MFKKSLLVTLLMISTEGLFSEDVATLPVQSCIEHLLVANGQDVNKALLEAVALRRADVVQLLLYKNPTNIDEAIQLSQKLKYKDVEKVLIKWKKLKSFVTNVAGIGIIAGALYGVFKVVGWGLVKCLRAQSYDEYEDADLNRKRLESGLKSQDVSLDNAIKIIDSLPEKKSFFLQDPFWREVVLASQFRHQDWIATMMGHEEKDIDDMSPTEAVMYKLKCKNPMRLQKYCEKQNISSAPLVGSYGAFEHVAQRVSQFEDEMKKQGFITLVHARKSDWDFVNDMWNMILAIKNKQATMLDRFHFRQRDDDCDSAVLERYRKELIEKGSKAKVISSINQDDKHSELTFCNRTFVSNMNIAGFEGYSPHLYYYKNYSWSDGSFGNKSIQHLLGLLKNFNLSEYEEDIKKLYEFHKRAQERGQLVCIGIHKDKFDNIVYRAKDLGYKADNTYSFDGNTYQQLPDKASEAMKLFDEKVKESENKFVENHEIGDSQQFYCAAALGIPGEGDETYRVKTITEYDESKREEYLKQRNKLFEKIKRDKGWQTFSHKHYQRNNNDFMGQLCFN